MINVNSNQSADVSLVEKFSAIFDQVQKEQPGFLKILDRDDLLKASAQSAGVANKKFEKLVVLGIGGSSLGGKTIANAFGLSNLLFLENVDFLSFKKQVVALGDLKTVHWVIISKSGKTLETIAQLHLVEQLLGPSNLQLKDQVTVISEKTKNPLTIWAEKNHVSVLEIPLDLGGRFSVLSPVGMFPAFYGNLKGGHFIEGAKDLLKNKRLFCEFCAQVAQSFQQEKWITVLWTYSDLLNTTGLWFQQLWAESLGKQKTLDGKEAPRASTPMPLLGTNDQHSVLQQVVEGARDKFVVFLRLKEAETTGDVINHISIEGFEFIKKKKLGDILAAQCEGTQKSLKEHGVPSVSLVVDRLDEKHLGALFLFFEMCVAMLGKYHNINTYDQPGVELSKKIAVDILKSSQT
jgi:glucose-6-phosphate isomerase